MSEIAQNLTPERHHRARGTLRARVLVFALLVVLLLVGSMIALMMRSSAALNRQAEARVTTLLTRLRAQQEAILDRVRERQLFDADEDLRLKGLSLARFLAKIAPVPLLTGDSEPLNDYCAQVCSDDDVLLCYLSDAKGRVRTVFRNERGISAGLLAAKFDSVEEVADALRRQSDRTMEISADIVQDGQRVGGVALFLSKQRALQQQASVAQCFNSIRDGQRKLIRDVAEHHHQQLRDELSSSCENGILAGAVIIVLGGIAAVWLSFLVATPLREAMSVLEAVAAGDLSRRMPEDGFDEVRRIAVALNSAIAAQAETLDALQHAKDAAEQASRSKSLFLANMSHEIRTPLGAVLGYAKLMLSGAAGETEAERREYLQIIYRSGRHLLGLIDDILDLSKIEAGQMALEAEPCSPHEILADVISTLRVRAQERQIELAAEWPDGVPEAIISDGFRLRQLLVNLVGNAIKFTERGSVRVIVRLRLNEDTPQITFQVRDTGIGIAPDKLQTIFEPFVQADNTVTRRFGGTGLGLAISRRIVDGLGGRLTVASELGQGSTFTLTLPTGPLDEVSILNSPPTDAVHAAREISAAMLLPGARVLLVEDGETNRKMLSLILRRAGATVLTAENGKAGFELAISQPFDVILMDMQMPVMDGYTAATKLRSFGLSTTPIIALTAHAMKGDEDKCRSAGCSGYLSKPIDPEGLIAAVAAALEGLSTSGRPPAGKANAPPTVSKALVSSLPTDDPEFREIVLEFIERLHAKVAEMKRAWASEDLTELARLAHWLKGSGGTAGFPAFTQPAKRLEQLTRQNQIDDIEPLMSEIIALASRVTIAAPADEDAAVTVA